MLNCMPTKSNCWLGTKLDLLKLITHPRCCNTCRTKSTWVLPYTADDAQMSQWSRYTWSLIPWSHRSWTTGHSNLVNSRGEGAKPNGRHVNWYTRPFTMNLRYFRTDLAMGTWRYVSCMSMHTVHSFSLMEARTEAWVSILNRGITRWSFKRERSMTGRKSRLFHHQEETAEETLGFWTEHWLYYPFGQELDHCRLQVLGRIPGAERDGCSGEWM